MEGRRAGDLHEATEAEGGVVEAGGLQKLLGAGLDLQQGHLRVLLAVKYAEEYVPLDPHRLYPPQINLLAPLRYCTGHGSALLSREAIC